MKKAELTNLDNIVNYISTNLLMELSLERAFKDEVIIEYETKYIPKILAFLTLQTNPVPIGALVGSVVNTHEDRIPKVLQLIEGLYETDVITLDQRNGNWIVYPLNYNFELHQEFGCNSSIIPKENNTVFCGNTLHNPIPSREDHLELLNSIKFKLNTDFLEVIPDIPFTCSYKKTLPFLLEAAKDSSVYVDHKYDGRGRTYCMSHINYQGQEWEKCLLQFHKEEKLTAKGKQNLTEYMDGLKEDEYFLQYVAAKASEDDKTGVFIGADARASGMQILSVLSGCEKSATHVGLLDKDNDPYQLAADAANFDLPDEVKPRDVFKPCCMQHFYGGRKTPYNLLGVANYTKFINILKEYFPGCENLKDNIQSIYWKTPIYIAELPDGFVMQQPVIDTKRIELSLPNYPEIKFGYAYKSLILKEKGLELAANTVHAVDGYIARELIYRAHLGGNCIDEVALQRALKHTQNFNDDRCFSLYKLLNTPTENWVLFGKSFLETAVAYSKAVKDMPSFQVISIHDDFKSHPNYLHWVKLLYVEILAEIADSTLIIDLLSQLNPNKPFKHKSNPVLADKMRTAFKNGTGSGLF
jgi:hypothetical protein